MLGLDGIQRASSSRIGPRASARSSRLTTIGLSRRFLAGSNAAADNYRTGNARSALHGELSRTRVQLPPPPPSYCSTTYRRLSVLIGRCNLVGTPASLGAHVGAPSEALVCEARAAASRPILMLLLEAVAETDRRLGAMRDAIETVQAAEIEGRRIVD